MLTVITMCSPCAQWVFGPLSPVSVENGGNFGNDEGNVEVCSLSDLALVTSLYVPADVVVEHGPPESNEQIPARSENSFVSKLVVSICDKSKTVLRLWN